MTISERKKGTARTYFTIYQGNFLNPGDLFSHAAEGAKGLPILSCRVAPLEGFYHKTLAKRRTICKRSAASQKDVDYFSRVQDKEKSITPPPEPQNFSFRDQILSQKSYRKLDIEEGFSRGLSALETARIDISKVAWRPSE